MHCAKFVWNCYSGSGEEDFLILSMYFFSISKLYPLGKGQGPSFEQTWIPFTQGCCVPSFVEIGPVVLEKKSKMWKVYRQTDDERQAIRKAHLSFQFRWAKNYTEEDVSWSTLGYHLQLLPCILTYKRTYPGLDPSSPGSFPQPAPALYPSISNTSWVFCAAVIFPCFFLKIKFNVNCL